MANVKAPPPPRAAEETPPQKDAGELAEAKEAIADAMASLARAYELIGQQEERD